MTFDFLYEEDGSLSLKAAVFQALGAASVCWDDMQGAGVFHDDEATQIADRLIEFISSLGGSTEGHAESRVAPGLPVSGERLSPSASPKDLWQTTVDKAMGDLLWATGGVNPDDPMVEAWQDLRDALLVTEAHAAWKDAVERD